MQFSKMKHFLAVFLVASYLLLISYAQQDLGDMPVRGTEEGLPTILRFPACRPQCNTSYTYTKDGVNFEADRHRTFERCGFIFISNASISDSGEYTLTTGGCEMSVNLDISERTPGRVGSIDRTPDMCMMQAIALEDKKRLLIDMYPDQPHSPLSNPIPSAESARRIRLYWHRVSEQSSTQSRARMLAENLMRMASDCVNSSVLMDADSMEAMLDFAQCDNPTDRYDCSSPSVMRYRTIDGTCNNMKYSLWGAANTAFTRLSPAVYEDGVQCPVGHSQQVDDDPFGIPWPSPRKISRRIVRGTPNRAPLSHIIAFFSQLIAHDLDLTGEFATRACEETCDAEELKQFCAPIPVQERDPAYGNSTENRGQCLPFTRSVAECLRPTGNETFDMVRQQLNQNTHYLDGSAVYGSTPQVAASIRSFTCGRLSVGGQQLSNGGNLPFIPTSQISPDPSGLSLFAIGDFRGNAITPLMVLQTLFVREHNRLARELAAMNPCWSDETLYQEARAIVIAKLQIITYEEFLPAIFGSKYDKYIGNYTGYDPSVMPIITNEFATAGLRFGHSLLGDSFPRLDSDNNPLPIGPLGFRDSMFGVLQYFISGGTDPLIRGSLLDRSKAADEFVNRVFTTQLFVPGFGVGQDVASRDIQRGRDHGLPPYRHYENFCKQQYGENGTFNQTLRRRLRKVYGRDGLQNRIDLWVGILGENHLEGAEIGPTAACLLAITFKDLRSGDRFWWDNRNSTGGPFTDAQRSSLSKTLFSKFICDNADDISSIKRKAFIAGGTPVDCSSLPSLDLELWRDESCEGMPNVCNPPQS